MAGCGGVNQPQQVANVDPHIQPAMDGEYWAKDNLDLQRVGTLLERSRTPQEFETYLNEDDGINNLDLNGDGYVDYISVDEFQDRDDYDRGLSLYTRFGPDQIQEIATLLFHRDDPRSPGARIFLRGNEQIYGDNSYYETNWLDRSLAIANVLFTPRDEYYRSPYYYDNYPSNYAVYEAVETPVYRARVQQLYPQPVFVLTTTPPKFTINSPYNGKRMDKIYAKLAKPTREQIEFRANNPGRPERVKVDGPGKSEDAPGHNKMDKPGKSEDAPGHNKEPKEIRKADVPNGPPVKAAKADKPGKPEKPGHEGKGKKKP